MASIVRSRSSRYWIAAFRDASGKQHRRSTREADKKRARAVAQQYERVAKRQGSPQRVRQVFSEFYREHYGRTSPSSPQSITRTSGLRRSVRISPAAVFAGMRKRLRNGLLISAPWHNVAWMR